MSSTHNAGIAGGATTQIEILYTPGCAHVDAARALLRNCLNELGLAPAIVEHEGAYPSPTILVNGVDVMGRTDLHGAMCRLDLPTRDRVLAALRTPP